MATAEEWKVRVREWKALGVTAREYCEPRGLAVTQLHNWAWELGMTSAGKKVVKPKQHSFLRVLRKPASAPKASTHQASPQSSGVRLRIGHVAVEIDTHFSQAALETVIATLAAKGAQ